MERFIKGKLTDPYMGNTNRSELEEVIIDHTPDGRLVGTLIGDGKQGILWVFGHADSAFKQNDFLNIAASHMPTYKHLGLDLPGNGRSGGSNNVSKHIAAINTASEYLSDISRDSGISIVGESYGGRIAAVAADNAVNLVLQDTQVTYDDLTPPYNLIANALRHFPNQIGSELSEHSELGSIEPYLENYEGNVLLVVSGEHGGGMPSKQLTNKKAQLLETLRQRGKGSTGFIPVDGATHFFNPRKTNWLHRLVDENGGAKPLFGEARYHGVLNVIGNWLSDPKDITIDKYVSQ